MCAKPNIEKESCDVSKLAKKSFAIFFDIWKSEILLQPSFCWTCSMKECNFDKVPLLGFAFPLISQKTFIIEWWSKNKSKENSPMHCLFLPLLLGGRWIACKVNTFLPRKVSEQSFRIELLRSNQLFGVNQLWESLLNAKKLDFSSCSYVSLTGVSCAYREKITYLTIL